jgi:tetratricopeptide (TPR) repeat protein
VWRRVFELTPEHPVAFRRAHELLSRRRDGAALIGLLSRKIDSLGPSAEALPHRFERALLHRDRGAEEAAAEDLATVLELEPGHVGALLALSEVRLAQGDSRAAAELLERYNETVVDPEQRAEGELRLAALLEGLGERDAAVNALDIALTARPDDLPARERLVALLVADGNAGRAAEELGRLAERRAARAERARDELRAARMWRDDAGDLVRARAAYERCLAAEPMNLEALRELAAITDGAAKTAALERAAAAVRALLVSGGEVQPLKFLAAIAALGGDESLGASAAGALEILGAASDEERRRRAAERQRLAAVPLRTRRGVSDDDWRSRLEHPGLRVALHEAWGALAESTARLAEVDPAQLGFTKGDRIPTKAMARSAPAVDAACKLLGIPELDLHVTSTRSTFARAVPLEVPMVLLSSDVARGESLEARTALARTLASARLRSGPVEDAPLGEVAVILAAGVRAAGGDPARVAAIAPHILGQAAKIEERARAVTKVLSRKDRKTLTGLLDRLAAPADLVAWQAALRATLRRVALLVGGDLPLALASVGSTRSGEAADLIIFGVGETYLNLRKDLGLA